MSASIDIRQTFFQECEELLEALDDGLTALSAACEDEVFDQETVNAVFRAVHSVKGGGAAFGLEALVRFAHHFETSLDALRSGRMDLGAEIVRVFLRSADYLAELVAAARDDRSPTSPAGPDLVRRLTEMVPTSNATRSSAAVAIPALAHSADADDLGFQPVVLSFDFEPTRQTAGFHIRFSATGQLYAVGHDPIHVFRSLEGFGALESRVELDALPPLGEMDWSEGYFAWDLTLRTTEPLAAVHEVFEFIDGLCTLEIAPLHAEEVVCPPFEEAAVEALLPEGRVSAEGVRPSAARAPGETTDRAAGGKAGVGASGGQKGSVRVDLELVDRLINIVGELVINQAVLAQCAQDAGIAKQSDVGTSLDEFRSLARELQENVMAIRAQSVKPLFQRMARIVREASDIAGKTVAFETEGDAVEVDKTVIEKLVDPLTHIIRNAIDHGLERSAGRREAGKPETGRVRLTAAHRSGRVLIEVSDDGAGINRPRVRQIAIDKGLIPNDATLEDSEIDKLLFLPGFSTASKVTDLSGRGVGMDVVRSAIQSLGGRVNISSTPGKGTTIAISLPLTLAVLDGMVVDVAGQTMVVPITAIVETLRPAMKDIHEVAAAGKVVAVREKFVPIIDLAEIFGHRVSGSDYSSMVLLLVECGQNERWALAVDRIHDQRQVVIKGLESNYGHVPGVAAATILGDGKIALIIDPDETTQRKRRSPGTATNFISEEA